MKIQKYTNGAWTDLDKPVKKYATYTDEATTLPLTIQTSATDTVENYEVFGASSGVGEETENLYNLRLWKDTYPDNTTVVGDTVYINTHAPTMYNTGISVDIPSGYYFTVTPTGAERGTTANRGRLRLIDENGTAHVYYVTNYSRNPLPKISEQLDFAVKKIGIDYTDMANGFGIKQLMFTSTAPTSYIPYGYKIPISLSDGTSTSNYDLFVGSTQLGEEEYLDYEEQKVYKRTAQLFNSDELVMVDNYYIKDNGETYAEQGYGYTENYFDVLPNETYSFINFYNRMVNTGCRLAFYDAQGNFLSLSNSFTPNDTNNKYIFTTASNCYKLRILYRMTLFPASNTTIVQGSVTPDPIPPYYQPIDPPTPFPTLATYIGENNISVDTTVQPEKVAVEYEGWKGVGDVEKYQNGEWVSS